jgi:hypothetical protein
LEISGCSLDGRKLFHFPTTRRYCRDSDQIPQRSEMPAVQEESDLSAKRSVQPCMRPVFRVEACPVAMQPLWLLALM